MLYRAVKYDAIKLKAINSLMTCKGAILIIYRARVH